MMATKTEPVMPIKQDTAQKHFGHSIERWSDDIGTIQMRIGSDVYIRTKDGKDIECRQ